MPAEPVPVRPSIASLLSEVVADAGGIVRAEAHLARLEVEGNVRAVGRSAFQAFAGLMFVGLALSFAAVAAVVALSLLVGLLWALLIVTGLCVATGVLLLRRARTLLRGVRLLPEASFGRMADDLERLSQRVQPPETGAGNG